MNGTGLTSTTQCSRPDSILIPGYNFKAHVKHAPIRG